jgi:hypothetical protein
MAAGLLEGPSPLQDGILKLNLHDSRLDAVLRSNVRQALLVIDTVGSIHLRGLARCLAYKSLKAVRNAVQAIKATGLIEVQAFRERELLRLIVGAIAEPANPIDEVPQAEFRAAFLDLSKSLNGVCKRVILLGDFADGNGRLGKNAEVLVVVKSDLNLARLIETLVEIAGRIEAGYGVTVHYTISTELDLVSFLITRRGIWPSIFMKAVQGIILTGTKIGHDGGSLFEAVQNTLTYSDNKITELLQSGTLARDEHGLAFTDLGIKRYAKLVRPPILHRVNRVVSLVGPPVSARHSP